MKGYNECEYIGEIIYMVSVIELIRKNNGLSMLTSQDLFYFTSRVANEVKKWHYIALIMIKV